jgi:hypothetical protein
VLELLNASSGIAEGGASRGEDLVKKFDVLVLEYFEFFCVFV